MAGRMIPVGRLAVATPASMALAIRADTEATTAVDERVAGVAAEIIASDPTVAQAAADAVDGALQDSGVPSTVSKTDPDNAVGAIGDENGTPTRWLRFDAAGMPSREALAALAEAGITLTTSVTYPDDPNAVGAIGDSAGQPTAYRWDGYGRPSAGALAKFAEAGIPGSAEVTDPHDPDAVGAIGDSLGNPTWLRFDAQGRPTSRVKQYICRMLGLYRGPAEPTFFPTGATYTWLVTDPSTGKLLDIRDGVGI